jgi:hypothetical protein
MHDLVQFYITWYMLPSSLVVVKVGWVMPMSPWLCRSANAWERVRHHVPRARCSKQAGLLRSRGGGADRRQARGSEGSCLDVTMAARLVARRASSWACPSRAGCWCWAVLGLLVAYCGHVAVLLLGAAGRCWVVLVGGAGTGLVGGRLTCRAGGPGGAGARRAGTAPAGTPLGGGGGASGVAGGGGAAALPGGAGTRRVGGGRPSSASVKGGRGLASADGR